MSRNGILLRIGVVAAAALLGWFATPLLHPEKPSGPFSLLPDFRFPLLARPAPDAAAPGENAPAAEPQPAANRGTEAGDAAKPEPPPVAPPCALPDVRPAPTEFLPDPVVAMDAPQPAPEDAELERRLARFPSSGNLSAEQVEHAHIAGRILFRRALYLQARLLARNLGQPDPAVSFPVPATAAEAEAKIREWLQGAVNHLTRVRPQPSYRYWSEALYLNAWALVLLQRTDEAVGFLQIVGRTQSQTLYANAARLSLVLHYLKQKNAALAAHWLVQITKVDPRHENLLAWVRLRTAVAARRADLLDAALWDRLFRLPPGEPITTAFLEQAASWCVQEKVDAACIHGHLARLSPAAKTAYLGFAALHTPRDPQNLQAICQLLGGK